MNFLEFLNYSVTPYHTVEFLRREFSLAGFECMDAALGTPLASGKACFVERCGALVAFRMPRNFTTKTRFRLALAHTDFPALKLTPNPDKVSGGVLKLHAEVYGSPLYTSWLDRDLGYAGMLAYEKGGRVQTKLVRGQALLRIPQLAVHLNRSVNQDGLKVNSQTDFDALFTANQTTKFVNVLRSELAEGERLLDFDVQLFDSQVAVYGGLENEWVYSGRLDNLSSCHAIAEALLTAEPAADDVCVACFVNNEEVGSVSRDGAAGNFVRSTLEAVWSACRQTESVGAVALPVDFPLESSFALSVDMAHAVHPNHPEKHEENHAPVLGGGVVLKTNSQKKYASDLLSSAKLRRLCEVAKVPLQVFVTRGDMPCGSTVGPTVSASLGIPTVDVGEPMLSMHSIREMMAVADHQSMTALVKALFSVEVG